MSTRGMLNTFPSNAFLTSSMAFFSPESLGENLTWTKLRSTYSNWRFKGEALFVFYAL